MGEISTPVVAHHGDDPDYAHKLSLIRRIAGREAVEQIKTTRKDLINANQVATSNPLMLSPDAAEYWQECQSVLAYGRMVHANPSRAKEKALSRKCEALEESFDARVPDNEKGKFLIYDIKGGNWDDRWDACEDWNFPILRTDHLGDAPIHNTMNEAQQIVLRSLVEEPVSIEDDAEAISARREHMARMRELASGDFALKAIKARKDEAKRQEAERRAAKIAAGDQQATKDIRAREYKVVEGLIVFPSSKGGSDADAE